MDSKYFEILLLSENSHRESIKVITFQINRLKYKKK